MGYDPERLINLSRWPLHKPGPARDEAIAYARAGLERDGCAVLDQFLTPQAVRLLTGEADRTARAAWRSFGRTNPYFTPDDPRLPASDPRRRFF